MSDEAKVFRGDSAPEPAQLVPSARTASSVPAPSFSPAADAASAGPALPESPEPYEPSAQAAHCAPAPALDFHVEQIERWHAPDAVTRRLARLAAVAHDTANQLDEQAQQAELIAKRMKSL